MSNNHASPDSETEMYELFKGRKAQKSIDLEGKCLECPELKTGDYAYFFCNYHKKEIFDPKRAGCNYDKQQKKQG